MPRYSKFSFRENWHEMRLDRSADEGRDVEISEFRDGEDADAETLLKIDV